jgi:hypothetical protein
MKPIFKENKDYNKNAFLNWRVSQREDIRNMIVLADSYLDASIKLTNICLIDNFDKKADGLIFVILNNANHGIELYLKALIWTLNKLIKNDIKFDGGHNLKQLLEVVQKRIDEHKGHDWLIHFKETNNDLISYINELFSLIDGSKMDFTRYPITKKGDNHFYIEEVDNIEIDLENLSTRLTNIKENLDERVSFFYYQELKGDW